MFDREPNIDFVFRNGLKDFEVLPPSDIWEEMPPLRAKPGRKKVVYAAVAALAIIMTISTALVALLRSPADKTDNIAAVTEEPSGTENISLNNSVTTAQPTEHISPVIKHEFRTADEGTNASLSIALSTTDIDVSAVQPAVNETETSAAETNNSNERVSFSQLFKLPEFSASGKNIIPVETEYTKTKSSRFMLGGSVAPAVSIISDGGDNNTKKLLSSENSLPELSAALSVRYKINSRFSIQTGLGITSVGQIVKGIDVYSGLSDYYSTKGKFNYVIQTSSGVIIADNKDVRVSDDSGNRVGTVILAEVIDPSKLPLDYVSSDVRQRFRYLEVPVVARYKIIDRRVDMNLCGGLSYGYLIENVAFATVNSKEVKVGYTEGINKNSISSQVGFGMEYGLSKSITFNFEPVVRYYLTHFSNASNAVNRPYSFGVYSGIFYRF